MRKIWGAAGIAAVALTAAACGSSASSSSSTPAAGSSSSAAPAAGSSGSTLDSRTISGKDVLTNSKGMTLYLFAPDTSTKSNCSGSCATYWPPVPGPATAGSGVTGKLGTVTRSDGTTQATYDGHPLYTYIGDTSPGQDKGNGLNLSGGLWYIVPVSGSTTTGGTTPTTSASSQGGYGY